MNYQEISPRSPFSEFIKCYWTLDDAAGNPRTQERVLPDGCVELIFHTGSLFTRIDEHGNTEKQPRSFIVGQIAQHTLLQPGRTIGVFAIRFRPGGMQPFLPAPLSEFVGAYVDVATLWGSKGRELEDRIITAPSAAVRIAIVEQLLLERLGGTAHVSHPIQTAVERIIATHGSLPIEQLSAETGFHWRDLERRFSASIGISPKRFSKLARFQHALALQRQHGIVNLTQLTYAAGYYDQSHFIREFREFAGITPSTFFGASHPMAELFIT
ncbi:MAG: DUF6597 domain-containing transcriptional factor [Bacteroidota bacterium]